MIWHKVSIIPIDDQGAIMGNQKVYGIKRWTPILREKKKKTQKRVKAKLTPFTRCSCQCLIDALSSIFSGK